MIKRISASIILLAFSSIALFGFFSMNHKHESRFDLHTCLAQTLQGKSCPFGAKNPAAALFHIHAIKSFFQAIFTNISLVIFLAGLFSALLSLLAKKSLFAAISGLLQKSRLKQASLKNTFSITSRIHFWSSLHEMSPTVS